MIQKKFYAFKVKYNTMEPKMYPKDVVIFVERESFRE